MQITDKHKEILVNISLNQYKHRYRMPVNNGQTIFKMNIDTTLITEATIIKTKNDIILQGEPGYIYLPCLNITNAQRKFSRVLQAIDNDIREGNIDKYKVKIPETSTSFSLKGDGEITDNKPQTNTQ
jgi:hypothetical protein